MRNFFWLPFIIIYLAVKHCASLIFSLFNFSICLSVALFCVYCALVRAFAYKRVLIPVKAIKTWLFVTRVQSVWSSSSCFLPLAWKRYELHCWQLVSRGWQQMTSADNKMFTNAQSHTNQTSTLKCWCCPIPYGVHRREMERRATNESSVWPGWLTATRQGPTTDGMHQHSGLLWLIDVYELLSAQCQ